MNSIAISQGLNTHTEEQLKEVASPFSRLLPAHRALVQGSAITPDVAAARGYQSVTHKSQLKERGFSTAQQLVPALLIPVRDATGRVATYQARPDAPRLKDGKPLKYETPAKSRMALDVPPGALDGLNDPALPLYITEGARKADSAVSHGLCCIALLGVWNWRGTNDKGGSTSLGDWENIAFRGKKDGRDFGRETFIVFDSDVSTKPAVEKALHRLKAFLESKGARVKVVYLPDGADGEKTGLDDFFARGGTVEELLKHARRELLPTGKTRERDAKNAAKIEALRSTGLALIETNGGQFSEKLTELAGAFAQANASAPTLFHGPGGLSCVARDNKGTLTIRRVTLDALRANASDAAKWISTTEREGIKDVAPPRDLCASFLETPQKWQGIPPLDSIATAPFINHGGGICQTPGYNERARVWLDLPAQFQGFELPDRMPTEEEFLAARRLIVDELLGEVAFADEASRAHAVALMLLPFIRRMIDGHTPLHLFDAPIQGSGKTHAAHICAAPFVDLEAMPEKSTDEEWRKSIICELVTGPSHIFLDNITGRLNSSTLAAAITSPYIRERLTGTGEMVTASTRVVWVATSNNAQLEADAAARTIVIRLDTQEENPAQRVYKRDPLTIIKANRGKVCAAILTLVRWWQRDALDYQGRHRCRFPQWQKITGGILEAAQIPGFLDNMESQRETLDTEGAAWRALCGAWYERHGGAFVPLNELVPLVSEIPDICGMLGNREGAARVRQLGMLLQKRRGRIFGGFVLVPGIAGRNGTPYRLEPKTPK